MKRIVILSMILVVAALNQHAQTQDIKNEQPAATQDPEVQNVKPQPVVQIRFKAKREEVSTKLGQAFGELFSYVVSSGGKMAMAPMSRYFSEADGVLDMAAAIAVVEPMKGDGKIEPSELPGGRAASAWHVGPYQKLTESYAALENWIAANGYESTPESWEIYWDDPTKVGDPQKLRTQIFRKLKE